MRIFHQYHTEPFLVRNHTIDYEPHLHKEVEIIVLFSGTAVATIGGKTYPIEAGDTVVVFPNTVHSYMAGDRPDVGKFIFAPDLITELTATFSDLSPTHPIVPHDHPSSDALHTLAATVIEEYPTGSRVVKNAYLALLVGKLLECCELKHQTYAKHDTVDLILSYCQANFHCDLSLDSLSSQLGISKSHLSHIFSDKVHMDFRNYLNTLRLNRAYKLLASTNLSMTEVAEQCGFSSLRTFNRTFQTHNGLSPTAYKKRIHTST